MSRERLIVALDVPTPREALKLVEKLGDAANFYKAGMQLLSAGGYMGLVDELRERGHKVFADLKFFDVPATVGAAVRGLSERGVEFLTVHGNQAVMEAAAENKGGNMKILAVTALTSLDRGDLDDLGFDCEIDELVLSRARRAVEAGCDGVIASGRELPVLRQALGDRLLVVTPGASGPWTTMKCRTRNAWSRPGRRLPAERTTSLWAGRSTRRPTRVSRRWPFRMRSAGPLLPGQAVPFQAEQPGVQVRPQRVEHPRLCFRRRMDSVLLHHAVGACQPFQVEPQQRDLLPFRNFLVQALELAGVVAAVVGRNPHADKRRLRPRVAHDANQSLEVGLYRVQRLALQAVVAAQLDNHHLGRMQVQQRRQTFQGARGGIAGYAGIDHAPGAVRVLEALL